MRVDKGFRGSVTVFAAMSFMLIVSHRWHLTVCFQDMKRNCWIDMECCYLMVPMRVMNLMSSI